jgi:SAM-dependent methyltransferase
MREEVYHQYAKQLSDDHWWVSHRRQVFSHWLRRCAVTADGTRAVLEFGSGVGTELSFLQPFGPVTGIELNPIGASYCRQLGYAQLHNGDINHCDFGKAAYDMVVDFHVLYHTWILSPHDVLRRAYAALRPGGYLLLTEPAFPALRRSHDQVVMAARRWYRKELLQTVASAGFSVRHWSGILVPIAPVALVLAKVDRLRPPTAEIEELKGGSRLAEAALRCLLAGERALVRHLPLPVGTCWALLAQKPA